uniref:Late embryogenesis abundant protein, LEA-14 n=1 Tax=Steinernema glaseri TaxID=37863 RepID=A0A1I8A4U8_9BILA
MSKTVDTFSGQDSMVLNGSDVPVTVLPYEQKRINPLFVQHMAGEMQNPVVPASLHSLGGHTVPSVHDKSSLHEFDVQQTLSATQTPFISGPGYGNDGEKEVFITAVGASYVPSVTTTKTHVTFMTDLGKKRMRSGALRFIRMKEKRRETAMSP